MKTLKRFLFTAFFFLWTVSGMAQNENALHFDGANDYVQLPVMVHNNMVTQGTLETWIKTNNAGSGLRGVVVREYYYGLFLNNNQLTTYNWTSGTISGTTYPSTAYTYTGANLNDDQWHHVALTFQLNVANGAQMYLDGQPVGPPVSLFYTGTQNSSFRLGANGAQPPYQGNMDDVKIYNRILTPAEINTSYNCGVVSSAGLQASYNFNQGVAGASNLGLTTLISSTTSNTNGTLTNFGLTGPTSNWANGKLCCFLSSNITGTTAYCEGQTISLNASFTTRPGETITGYQWKKNGINLSNGGNISGATSANLQITNIVPGDYGNYTVEVTSTCGVGTFEVNVTESGTINIGNLTAHYPFNNNTLDVSGNNYNASPFGGLTATVNRFGQANSAYAFNGTTGEVRIAAPTAQTILGNGQNKSISLWFKRSSTSSKGILVGYENTTPTSAWNPLAYIDNAGVLRGRMYMGNNSSWSSGIVIDTNWHNLVLVYTTDLQTAYLDGAAVASLSGTLQPGSSNLIRIGNGYAATADPGISVTGNQPFQGKIDEVRFYNSVLTLADISTIAINPFLITNQPQIVGCIQIGVAASLSVSVTGSVNYQWQKNGIDIPGATLNTYSISNVQQSDFGLYRCVITDQCDNTFSSVSNEVSLGVISIPQPSRVYTFDNNNDDHLLRGAYHSVLNQTVNTPATFASDRFGVPNSAHFRGTWTSINLNKSLNSANMTISMWVYINSAGSHFFLSPLTNSLPYHLWAQSNELRMTTASGTLITIPYVLPTTQWVQITMVYQGNTNILYVNGQHVFTTNSGINPSVSPIGTIAGLGGGANSARYVLDDVYVFEQALSVNEVRGLYADGGKAPYFYTEPINDMVCESNAIRFDFQSALAGSVVSVKKNGVDLPAGGNVVITETSVVISNPTAADFTNYTITLSNGCGSVSKTVNAVNYTSGFETNGLVRNFEFNNNLNDSQGGASLSVGGFINYTTDRFGNTNAAYQQVSGSSLFLPTAAVLNNTPFTVSFWVNDYPTNSSHQLFSTNSTSSVGLNAQNQYLGFSLGGNNVGFKHVNVFTGGWRMLTLTFDGLIAKIYSNETLISVHRPQNGSTSLQTFINQLQCQIDDIRIYNRVLADEEVRGLYRIFKITAQPQAQSVCEGQTANLSVNAQATAGNTLIYQWTFNGNPLSNGGSISGATTNNLQIANAQASNSGTYNCIVSSGCNTTSSSSVALTVGAGNVNITQQPQNTSVCQGNSATFSITTLGATVTYQWKKNGVNIGGATNATLNLTNVNSSDAANYTVDIIGGSCGTITSQVATLTVLSLPSATITPASPSICEGQSITLIASGGTSYSWDSGLGSGDTKTVTPATTTTYSVVVTGANSCQASASQTVTVNNTSAPTGTTTQTFCNSATVANLTATGTGIQWYAASTGGIALSTGTALSNGTTYYASQTVSACESVNRFAVSVTINTPAAPTGTASQTVCSGATMADLSATGSNIQWYAAASGGSALATSTAVTNGTTYYASQTISGCESATRLAVTVTIGIPNAPTGGATQTFCNSGTVADLTASGSNILWYTAPTGGTALAAGTALTNGSTYYASQTAGGCESTNRLAVTVTINAPATPTGSASQEFCNTGTVADLSATGSSIQWYTAPTGGTALASGTALSNGTFYASQTISGCESVNRLAVTVNINAPSGPSGAASQTICGAGTLADLTVSGSNITWYDAASAGNALGAGTALADGTTYYASQTVNGCESVSRVAVTVTVNAIPSAPTGDAAQTFCSNAMVMNLSATGSGLTWYPDATSTTPLNITTTLVNGATYYATQTPNGCESADRLAVTVTINDPIAPTGDALQTFCSSTILDDLIVSGTNIQWYTVPTGGTPLSGSLSLSNNIYYASQTVNGCESSTRLAVEVIITILNNGVTQNGLDITATQSGASYTWVDCNNSNQPIAGATAQTYTATANGSYAVIVEQNGCAVTSNCMAITTVGLDDIKTDLFRVYPNPASTVINVEMANTSTIRLFDVSGKLLKEVNGSAIFAIDVTDLTPGMYMIESAEGAKAKFIKE